MLLCAYRPTYLHATLKWLQSADFNRKYRLFAWDNGGAESVFRQCGLKWHSIKDEGSGKVRNVGKALAMRHLFDAANEALPELDCYICMDDDIVVDSAHLDALVKVVRRPAFGMIAGRMHAFNSAVPSGGKPVFFDPCPAGCINGRKLLGACSTCGGLGKDRNGLQLLTFPPEDRLIKTKGKIAGGLFAVSRAAASRLPWAPHLYPILTDRADEPIPYWTEDASLDHGLTQIGLINGYLQNAEVTPAIHLPDLNESYVEWKKKAREAPQETAGFLDPLT